MLRRFVEVRAQLHGVANHAQLRREIKIVRRVVDRVAAQNQQRIDFAGVHVRAKLAQRFQLVDGIGFDRFGIVQRVPRIAERRVDRVDQSMNFRGLLLPGDDQRAAAMALEVLRDAVQPFFGGCRKRTATAETELRR